MASFDVKPGDIILAEDKHKPIYALLSEMPGVELIAGGATQNSARVAQAMVGVPNSVTYTGSVGKDNYAKSLRDSATKGGVSVPYYEVDDGTPTGTCAVLVRDRERALIANLSAANLFNAKHLSTPAVWSAVEAAGIYYSAGFFLTVSVEALEKVGKHAAEANKLFCLNLSAPFICQFFKDQMMTILPYADILFGNETEAVAFAEAQGWGITDTTEIAKRVRLHTKVNGKRQRVVVITHGANPAVVVDEAGEVSLHPVVPIEQAMIVDVNGAGDAFVGGFLAQKMLGNSLAECTRGGLYASWVVIQESGCKFPASKVKTNFSR